MYLQQYEVSMTILDYFYPRLKNYIDFDFTDQLSPPRLKKDGNYYATYVSEIRQEHAVLSPDRCSVVLKEIPASLTEISEKSVPDGRLISKLCMVFSQKTDILWQSTNLYRNPPASVIPQRSFRKCEASPWRILF